jgi:hypothetical protein
MTKPNYALEIGVKAALKKAIKFNLHSIDGVTYVLR